MRLINCQTRQLEEFFHNIPEYAILSHTWGAGELTLQEWISFPQSNAREKLGYAKIDRSCQQAVIDGINHVWVDTCCIDKTSSAELSEAINSMFAFYRNSKVCYAYLADVGESDDGAFRNSRWFRRGWTLQELIAPTNLIFYSKDWTKMGTKVTKRAIVSRITGIDSDYLRQPDKIYQASVARRMSWMANRTTTRLEDMAYCMLGIFNINMALLYGEGNRAFLRLQEEIIRVSDDQTIFCWRANRHTPHDWVSILSPNPTAFEQSAQFYSRSGEDGSSGTGPYAITNHGLRISLPLFHTLMGACIVLNVGIRTGRRDQLSRVLVRLHRISVSDKQYVRLPSDLMVTQFPPKLLELRTEVYIDCRNARSRTVDGLVFTRMGTPHVEITSCSGRVLILGFNKPVKCPRTPHTQRGIVFHDFDSVAELPHDATTERCGIVLKVSVDGSRTVFGLLLAALRASSEETKWHLNASNPGINETSPGISDLRKLLNQLSEDAFGTWSSSGSVETVHSWETSEGGAIVCYVELANMADDQRAEMKADDERFQHLRMSSTVSVPSGLPGS